MKTLLTRSSSYILPYTTGLLLIFLATSCATTTSTLDSPDLQRTYTASYNDVFSNAVSAVALLSWELKHSEKDAGIIQAKTSRNIWTEGDDVTISLRELDSGEIRVDVSSGTKQAIDWGKNKRNITRFFEELDELLSST